MKKGKTILEIKKNKWKVRITLYKWKIQNNGHLPDKDQLISKSLQIIVH